MRQAIVEDGANVAVYTAWYVFGSQAENFPLIIFNPEAVGI